MMIFLGLLFLFMTLILVWLRKFQLWRQQLPPGPPCLPIIGNLGQIDTSGTLAEYQRLRTLYGDVFCFVIGSQPTVVVNGMSAMKELLLKEADALSDRPEIFVLRKLNKGLGIIASNGDLWKEHRGFAVRTIRDLGLGEQSLESHVQQEVQNFLQKVCSTEGQPFDPTEMLKVSIVNIVSWLMFGKRFDDGDRKFRRLLSLIDSLVNDSSLRGIAGYIPFAEYIPGDPFKTKRRRRMNNEIVSILQEEIESHRGSYVDGVTRDYIDAFIRVQRKEANKLESTFTDEQLLQTIRDFFVAGTDTTVTALRWALIHLIHNPDIQHKMKEEIHRNIGSTKMPSLQDKVKLPYCEAVIMESQRLNHAIPVPIPHGAKYDVRWKNYLIPRGTMVMLNLDSIAKDPDTFPNPDLFDPHRFLNPDGTFNSQKLIIPFSAGKRSCPGESIARMEICFFLTALVQRFNIKEETDNILPSTKALFGATNNPIDFKMRAEPIVQYSS